MAEAFDLFLACVITKEDALEKTTERPTYTKGIGRKRDHTVITPDTNKSSIVSDAKNESKTPIKSEKTDLFFQLKNWTTKNL